MTINLPSPAKALIAASVSDLESSINCAIANDHPISLEILREAMHLENHKPGRRSSIVKLLQREIKRQEKLA